jgi:hypothetical protein
MDHILSSSSFQTFKNGKFNKHVEEEEIMNGKRVNYINYDVYNNKNSIITEGKQNNKRFSYKMKVKGNSVSLPYMWGMPISSSLKNRIKSKNRRNGYRNKRKTHKKEIKK